MKDSINKIENTLEGITNRSIKLMEERLSWMEATREIRERLRTNNSQEKKRKGRVITATSGNSGTWSRA